MILLFYLITTWNWFQILAVQCIFANGHLSTDRTISIVVLINVRSARRSRTGSQGHFTGQSRTTSYRRRIRDNQSCQLSSFRSSNPSLREDEASLRRVSLPFRREADRSVSHCSIGHDTHSGYYRVGSECLVVVVSPCRVAVLVLRHFV